MEVLSFPVGGASILARTKKRVKFSGKSSIPFLSTSKPYISAAGFARDGSRLQLFFNQHFGAACRVIGWNGFQTKFLKESGALRQCLWMGVYDSEVLESSSRKCQEAVSNSNFHFAADLQRCFQ